jgi:radical SAM superfamily enzyme YgiQ (UPF0313 family)
MPRKRILLIRTFRPVGTGGPVPPLGLLYVAASLRRDRDLYDVKVIDVGNEELERDDIRTVLSDFKPHYVGLSTMTCEADVMEEIAADAKEIDPSIHVIVGGPHSNTTKEKILNCPAVDTVVIQEGEVTIVELLAALEGERDLAGVYGIAYRRGTDIVVTPPRPAVQNLDDVPFPAWDLIDIPSYSRHRNWNGTLKHAFYAPICTSRGCPYSCTFCHNIFGKNVRKHSPERVLAEMKELNARLGCREFHVVDDIFNVDVARASKTCRLIIESDLDVAISFPNGLRADIMTDELLRLLKDAGTYKINYGFETANDRLQKIIKKGVQIEKAREVFAKTSRLGIITGAYFMLGIPTETREEMENTIRFAETSELDLAAFFKSTAYPGTELYDSLMAKADDAEKAELEGLHFFSTGRSYAAVSERELNAAMVEAQRRFYMKPSRILRGFKKAPQKTAYLKNLFSAALLVLQGYLVSELKREDTDAGRAAKATSPSAVLTRDT